MPHQLPPDSTILALESSCDDTAVAIVKNGRQVLGSLIYSQNESHAQYGGVVPEAAARLHIEQVNVALEAILQHCALKLDDIDAFAATLGPGLVGSLLVGANTAKTLSFITGKPFVGVHHLRAHIASTYLENTLEPPFICLLVSGGHTQLVLVSSYTQMTILGETRDDAAGEAYDKIARLMQLGYPGGPAIDQLASEGNPLAFKLPRAQMDKPFDFSFSGLKTAASRLFEKEYSLLPDEVLPSSSVNLEIPDRTLAFKTLQANMAASFQYTVVETLFKKTVQCAKQYHLNTIAVAGGVSANRALKKRFADFERDSEGLYKVYFPQPGYSTDNAAMVGACAYFDPLTTDMGEEVFSRSSLNRH
jgi:N6-L-threonylcarbamoyladenine synthase